MAILDLIGQKFGKLTVIKHIGRNNKNEYLWECKCECGETAIVKTYSLNKGLTRSCGCLSKDLKHKHFKIDIRFGINAKINKHWKVLHERCYNTNNKNYHNYGGRGIEVGYEWNRDNVFGFLNFYIWYMQNPRPDGYSLDRINNEGNYCSSNVRWATQSVQVNNTRVCKYTEVNGELLTFRQIADKYKLTHSCVYERYKRGKREVELIVPKSHIGGDMNKLKGEI